MATKPTQPALVDVPQRDQVNFSTKADAFVAWQAGAYYTYIGAASDYVEATNVDIQAAAVAANIFDVPLTGLAGQTIAVNGTEDGFVAITVPSYTVSAYSETLLDDADAAAWRTTLGLGTFAVANTADYVQSQATWNTGTDTTEATITAAKLEAKLEDKIPSSLNASGSAPLYACRAWVNFNGDGTVAIRASGNVSSITDNGTGDYTVNFTTAMDDADYAVNATTSRASNSYELMATINSAGLSASSFRFGCFSADGIKRNGDIVCVAIFR